MRDTEPKRILVVEDDPNLLLIVKLTLTRIGLHVQTATDGREALDVLGKESFDLILTDYCMSHVDGIELITALRSDGRHADTPVMLMSALSGTVDLPALCQGLNVLAIVSKPFSPAELREIVQNGLNACV